MGGRNIWSPSRDSLSTIPICPLLKTLSLSVENVTSWFDVKQLFEILCILILELSRRWEIVS